MSNVVQFPVKRIVRIVPAYQEDIRIRFAREVEQRFSMIEAMTWGCALVDCAPGEARRGLAARLAHRCTYVVCHDSEKDYGSGGNYEYEKLANNFQYITEFRRMRPYTLVLSNVERFGIEDCDGTWKAPNEWPAV